MEPTSGIEPEYAAWKAAVLPLNYVGKYYLIINILNIVVVVVVIMINILKMRKLPSRVIPIMPFILTFVTAKSFSLMLFTALFTFH